MKEYLMRLLINSTILNLLYKYLPRLKQANTYALKLTYIFNYYSTQK